MQNKYLVGCIQLKTKQKQKWFLICFCIICIIIWIIIQGNALDESFIYFLKIHGWLKKNKKLPLRSQSRGWFSQVARRINYRCSGKCFRNAQVFQSMFFWIQWSLLDAPFGTFLQRPQAANLSKCAHLASAKGLLPRAERSGPNKYLVWDKLFPLEWSQSDHPSTIPKWLNR